MDGWNAFSSPFGSLPIFREYVSFREGAIYSLHTSFDPLSQFLTPGPAIAQLAFRFWISLHGAKFMGPVLNEMTWIKMDKVFEVCVPPSVHAFDQKITQGWLKMAYPLPNDKVNGQLLKNHGPPLPAPIKTTPHQ